jgi:hypothetical protein
MNRTQKFRIAGAAGWVVAALLNTSAHARGDGFEVGNAWELFHFGTGSTGSLMTPSLNGIYGKFSEKPTTRSKTRLRMRTFNEVRYEAFRELRFDLEPRGFESVRASGLDAMEREGMGHGEGRCSFEIRFLNASQALVAADYEAVPNCTLEQAMRAVQDSLETVSLLE